MNGPASHEPKRITSVLLVNDIFLGEPAMRERPLLLIDLNPDKKYDLRIDNSTKDKQVYIAGLTKEDVFSEINRRVNGKKTTIYLAEHRQRGRR